MTPLLSILMASIRPVALKDFLDNVEDTLDDPASCEVLLKIDAGDEEMGAAAERESRRRHVALRVQVSPRAQGYWSLPQAYNDLLALRAPESYYVLNLNDQARFADKGWDRVLRDHVGYFPDHVFHLRLSSRRAREFPHLAHTLPLGESFGVFTRRWIELTEGHAIGRASGDSGQESVTFFLRTRFGLNRGVPIDSIRFADEERVMTATGDLPLRQAMAKWHRIIELYASTLSQDYCERYVRAAARLAGAVHAGIQGTMDDVREHKVVRARAVDGIRDFPYEVSLQEWIQLLGDAGDLDSWPPLVAARRLARRQFSEHLLRLDDDAVRAGWHEIAATLAGIAAFRLNDASPNSVDETVLSDVTASLLDQHGIDPDEPVFRRQLLTSVVQAADDGTPLGRLLAAILYFRSRGLVTCGVDLSSVPGPPVLHQLDDLPKDVPTVVYGAGRAGRIVLAALERRGYRVAAVVDTFAREPLDGRAVMDLDTFMGLRADGWQIVIASQAWEEIAFSLEAVTNHRVYSAHELIQTLTTEAGIG